MYRRGEGDARGDFDARVPRLVWRRSGRPWPRHSTCPTAWPRRRPRGPRLSVTFINKQAANPDHTGPTAPWAMTVRANRELQHRDCERPSERSTRHLEIALPPGVTYEAGDHLGIVPRNGLDQIRRVLLRFKLDPGLYLTITPYTNASTHLPVNEPVPLLGVLANRVELQDVATRAQLATLAEHAQDAAERDALLALAGDDDASQARYREQVLAPRKSVLDLLDEFPSCALPFEVFLDMLPPLRPRYYSISSSPLVSPDTCSITVGVVEAPARSGHGAFQGVCSNYLAAQPIDATVYGFIRKPTIPFHPPENPHLPMIMVGPGTGVAPFRGFLQERAALKQQGVPVGRVAAVLRLPRSAAGLPLRGRAAGVRGGGGHAAVLRRSRASPASRRPTSSRRSGSSGDDVWRLLQQEAVIFVCGDASRMAPDVRQAFAERLPAAHRHLGRRRAGLAHRTGRRATATSRTSGRLPRNRSLRRPIRTGGL